jgi:hypothetical protein
MKMRIIKTMKDIGLLKESEVVKRNILGEIEEHFKHIYKNLGEGIPIEEFSLVNSEIIVSPEAGDNVTELEEIGLSSADNGLLGAMPEWIELQDLADCILITTCILCNNEYALSIFLESGKFGEEVENWISENI